MELNNLPWDDILYENIIDNKINILNTLILTLFDRHVPMKESFITKPQAP